MSEEQPKAEKQDVESKKAQNTFVVRVNLTENQYQLLDEIRQYLGLKTLTDTVRFLIVRYGLKIRNSEQLVS